MTHSGLPSFAAPPVVEVVTSAQFEPLQALTVPTIGLLWQRFREKYPIVEQQAPLPAVVERLGIRTPMNTFRMEMSTNLMPRVWFVNSDNDALIQIQNDRFIRNWRRKADPTAIYPRYQEHIRPRFFEDYECFLQFLIDEKIGPVVLNQCELTYVNNIAPNQYWNTHADVAAVFRGWTREYSGVSEFPVEALQLAVTHVISAPDKTFVGRLHVTLQSAFVGATAEQAAEAPVFVLTLTARGRPLGAGDAGIVRFLDLAHEAIVTSFERMTTPQMHAIWRKEQ